MNINKESFAKLLVTELLDHNIEISKTFSLKCVGVLLSYISDKIASGKSFKVAKGYYLYAKVRASKVGYDFHKNESIEISPFISVRIVKKSLTERVYLKDVISDLKRTLSVTRLFVDVLVKTLYKCVGCVVGGEGLVFFRGFGSFKPVVYKPSNRYVLGKGCVSFSARNGVVFKVSKGFRLKCELSGFFEMA